MIGDEEEEEGEYREEFQYCTIDGELDFEAFIQHWDKAMPGSLFRILFSCQMLVQLCPDDSSIVELDREKIEKLIEEQTREEDSEHEEDSEKNKAKDSQSGS